MPAKDSLTSAAPLEAAESEFFITRLFDAPRNIVWRAWTQPQMLAQWWGPRGFTNPVCEHDLRVGGAYRITMRSPEGEDYPLTGVYQEITEPERLVMTMDPTGHPVAWHDMLDPNRGSNPNPAGVLVQTVTFEDLGAKTRLSIRTRFESAEIAKKMKAMGMNDGWGQSLDRLAETLATGAPAGVDTSDRQILMTRLLDAPRVLVYQAWTRPEHVVQWWGPNGFTTTTKTMDVRSGGNWRYTMHGPDGTDYPNLISYIVVDPPRRLVYEHGGGEGDLSGMNFHVTVTFDDQDGKTLLTMRSLFATVEEYKNVVEKYGALEGARQHLGNLEAYLAAM